MDLESLSTPSVDNVITEHFDIAILLSSFKMKKLTLCWKTANFQQLTIKAL